MKYILKGISTILSGVKFIATAFLFILGAFIAICFFFLILFAEGIKLLVDHGYHMTAWVYGIVYILIWVWCFGKGMKD